MSFINELYVIDEVLSLGNRKSIFNNNLPGGIRHCEWLPLDDTGRNCLSIQASEYHHCIPRALIPLEDYTHFEMALIFEGNMSKDMSILKGFNRYDKLMECYSSGVFVEVPKDLIEELYIYLK